MDPAADKDRKALHALLDSAIHFGSDLTRVIGRDEQGNLQFLGLVARGRCAEVLEKMAVAVDFITD